MSYNPTIPYIRDRRVPDLVDSNFSLFSWISIHKISTTAGLIAPVEKAKNFPSSTISGQLIQIRIKEILKLN